MHALSACSLKWDHMWHKTPNIDNSLSSPPPSSFYKLIDYSRSRKPWQGVKLAISNSREELTHEKRFPNSFRAIIYSAALLLLALFSPVTNILDHFFSSTHKLYNDWFLGW